MTNEIPFESEYMLHNLTQKHLKELFDLEFIASEFQLNNLRLDNLVFDKKTNSFVIIEYKNTEDDQVLNQSQDYYELLQKNKKDFSDRLNENSYSPINIDFTNTRVMIIGPEFSEKQIEEVKVNRTNFELWKISLYDNGEVTYKNVITNEAKSLKIDLDDLKLNYENLFEDKSKNVCELYCDLEKKLTYAFDDLKLRILVDAVSFRANNKLICLVNLKNNIKIHFFTDKLNDSENKTRDISDITTGGLANYELTITSEDEIDYAFKLFEQVYDEKSL